MNMIQAYKKVGFRGMCEKLFFNTKKLILKMWYFNRFASSGKNVVFEGAIDLRGGKGIRLGNNIVFGKNVKLHCSENAEITIEDGCYIAQNVLVSSEDKVRIGKGCRIHENAVLAGGNMTMGDNVWVSRYCILTGTDIVVEDECIFAPFVSVLDTDHYIDKTTGKVTMDSGETNPVKIGKNVWVCSGSKILKGVNVGDGAIIATGAVVTKSVSSKTVVAGVPAVMIKDRK
ncbi:acyltransferase [Candidatus Omnitrophota bacterium]